MKNAKVSVVQGVEELMAILAEAGMKSKVEVGQAVAAKGSMVVARVSGKGNSAW